MTMCVRPTITASWCVSVDIDMKARVLRPPLFFTSVSVGFNPERIKYVEKIEGFILSAQNFTSAGRKGAVGGGERPRCQFFVILLHQNCFSWPGEIESEFLSLPEATERQHLWGVTNEQRQGQRDRRGAVERRSARWWRGGVQKDDTFIWS